MLEQSQFTQRVLAVYPVSGAFGFVVFEGPHNLIDWGMKSTRHTTGARCIDVVKHLTSRYAPDAVVTEKLFDSNSRRGRRMKHLVKRIVKVGEREQIRVESVSRSQARDLFAQSEATTKQQMAIAIAKQFHELYYSLPKPRKCFMSEDARMSIFEAAALALTFYSANADEST